MRGGISIGSLPERRRQPANLRCAFLSKGVPNELHVLPLRGVVAKFFKDWKAPKGTPTPTAKGDREKLTESQEIEGYIQGQIRGVSECFQAVVPGVFFSIPFASSKRGQQQQQEEWAKKPQQRTTPNKSSLRLCLFETSFRSSL